MKDRYASMPDWLYRFLRITEAMDKGAFRWHDRDYGTMAPVAPTRAVADAMLRDRLIAFGMAPLLAWSIWAFCRLFLACKYQRRAKCQTST